MKSIQAMRKFGEYVRAPWYAKISWVSFQRTFDSSLMTEEEVQQMIEHGDLPRDPMLRRFAIVMRSLRYSLKTEESYVHWVRRCARWHRLKSPADIHCEHVAPFLENLAANRRVSASTQKCALSGLILFLREVQGWSIRVFAPINARRGSAIYRWCVRVRKLCRLLGRRRLKMVGLPLC